MQKDNYTQIPNEVLERMYLLHLNGTQRNIIDVVWRYTYGYQRESHSLSVSFIAEKIETHYNTIQKEIKKLIERNIITEKNSFIGTKPRELSFNVDYTTWNISTDSQSTDSQSTDSQSVVTTHNQLVVATHNQSVVQLKKKENIKENIYEHFEQIWELYPKKKGKGQISDSKKKELAKIPLEEWKRIIDRYKKYIADNNTEEKFIMYGSTFFNRGYIDYTGENYQEPKRESAYEGIPLL